jgi:(1->4)-alpha-D-glucan 1-alpha-D-glucosylmutase
LYVVLEKILEQREHLPTSWPVYGTTGYAFLNQLNGLFVDRRQVPALRSLYAAFVGVQEHWPNVLYTAKKLILKTSMSSELHALGAQLERLAATDRTWRDLTRQGLTAALREVIACFPVYRTYIGPQTTRLTAADRAAIDTAVAEARRRNPTIPPEAFDYLQATLQVQEPTARDPTAQQHQRLCIQKFQQLTGPVMAKGLEDTALYRYTPLASLNDVGGDPDAFGLTVTAFHRYNRQRQQHWPLTLLATATHDTKRGEDVRARLNVLSELPQVWGASLQRWHQLNRPHQPVVDGQPVPARQEEYLLYQTLLGVWPFAPFSAATLVKLRKRMQAYMRKALREAKVHTSWTWVHAAYEQAVDTFIARLLDDTVSRAFLEDFRVLHTTVALYGLWNSLAQTLLKLTVPGVPDIYQGCELWDFSLVDPDNRRPVDYALRQQYLAELQQRCQEETRPELVQDLLRTRTDGRIKLYVIWQTLTLRRAQAAVFRDGAYLPLEVQGRHAAHVCAFARVHATAEVVVVVPRLFTRLLPQAHDLPLGVDIWGDTGVVMSASLRGGRYRQLFTGGVVESSLVDGSSTLPLAAVLAHFPVAVLERVA